LENNFIIYYLFFVYHRPQAGPGGEMKLATRKSSRNSNKNYVDYTYSDLGRGEDDDFDDEEFEIENHERKMKKKQQSNLLSKRDSGEEEGESDEDYVDDGYEERDDEDMIAGMRKDLKRRKFHHSKLRED